jgi:hypothetical protein
MILVASCAIDTVAGGLFLLQFPREIRLQQVVRVLPVEVDLPQLPAVSATVISEIVAPDIFRGMTQMELLFNPRFSGPSIHNDRNRWTQNLFADNRIEFKNGNASHI